MSQSELIIIDTWYNDPTNVDGGTTMIDKFKEACKLNNEAQLLLRSAMDKSTELSIVLEHSMGERATVVEKDMEEIPSAYHEFEQIVFTDCGMNVLFGVGDCDLFVDGAQLYNHLPIAIAGEDQIVNPGTVATLNASESFDQDGTIENYTWTQLSGAEINMQFSDSAYANFIVPQQGGYVIIQLEVYDNEGAVGRDTISFIINSPPTANAGEDQQVGASVVVLLDGSMSTDVNNNIESYSWSQISGTNTSLFSSNQDVATFYSPEVLGEISFELSVFDEMGLEGKDTTNINVTTLMVGEKQHDEKNKLQIS